jgi:hypothetical protein
MSHPVILVDFENVQKVDLSRVPDDAQVRIFLGASQTKAPVSLWEQAQAMGTRVQLVRIDGQGSNALDFHIAFYLGEYIARSPGNRYVILSRDKGFDPLIRHMNARGHECRRVASLDELARQQPVAKPAAQGSRAQPSGRGAAQRGQQARVAPQQRSAPAPRPAQADDPQMARILKLLGKLEKKERPRRRRTLETQIASYFRNENALPADAIAALVQRMFDERLISETNSALTYHF